MARGQDQSFGVLLRRLRETAGLTQEELASRAGLTAKGIGGLERGERKHPYPHTVRSLAEALELPEEERAALLASVPRRGEFVLAPSKTALGSTVPIAPTPLIGRERDVGAVRSLLEEGGARLVTLTGPGGVGKTRLALEVANEAGSGFPDGVAFVALAPLADPDLLVPTIAQALGLREAGGRPVRELVYGYLREKRLLLVLDNLEHLLEAAPEIAMLLESCASLRVLVTSRAPLRVRGEREYPVGPLTVPDPARAPDAEGVAASPAAELFVDRAREANPSFLLTGRNAAAVAAICRRLDGLPLALELAAARTRFLGPTELLSRLDRALEAGGARDLPERQRTMRATLDWSYDLLHEPERELFRRLSVFAGGFTLEAAEEVCATGAVEAADVLMLLGNLVEQSLVLAETGAEEVTRYRMLEPVRQYALERLRESGEEDGARLGHARYYLALAEEAEPHIKGHDQVAWLDMLEAENDNLRAAIGWSLEAGDTPTAARFGWALGFYWVMRTRHGEGRLLMEQTLAQGGDELPTPLRAKALWALGSCVYGSGDDERLMVIAEEGVALSRRAGDRQGEAYTLGLVGYAALQLGDLDQAERVLKESLEMVREQGDAWRAAHFLNHLAVVALNRGEHQRAAGYAEGSLALTRQTGDRYAANVALSLLAQMAWASGEHERAAGHWREALRLSYELASKANSASSIQGLATVASSRGELRRAARLLGAAEALLEAAGLVLYAYTTYTSNEPHQRAASAAREELGELAWSEARAEGRAMTFEKAVEYALEDDEALST